MSQGPNVRRLIAYKASLIMVLPGGGQNLVTVLTKPGNVVAATREATAWVEQAIAAVRLAALPNPYSTSSDEVIAGVILEKVEDRLKAQRKPWTTPKNPRV